MHALLMFFLLFACIPLAAQQKSVPYEPGFEFKEGIYLSVWNFKNNNPIPPASIVFNSNRNDKSFLKHVLDKTTFTYIDSAGKEQQVKTEDAWGYSSNGTVYINYGTDFSRVTVIGSICHFVATIPMRLGVADPFYNNQPFDSRQQFTYVSEQLIIDMESGNVLRFGIETLEPLLSRDEALYKEFTSLKKKQKRDSVFLYLRKYNEKHPIFFPE